jgi:hypothetical protein
MNKGNHGGAAGTILQAPSSSDGREKRRRRFIAQYR